MNMREYKRLSAWLAVVLVGSFAAAFAPLGVLPCALIPMSIVGLLLCQFADRRKIQPTGTVLLFGASWLLVVGSAVAVMFRPHALFFDPEHYVTYVLVTSILSYCSWTFVAWMTVSLCFDWWQDRARLRRRQDSNGQKQ